MNNSERKEYFFRELNEFYKTKGYTFLKSKNSFSKKNEDYESLITYNIWPEFMQVEPSYEIIIKEVEKIKKKAFGNLYKKSWSVGQQKAYLSDDPENGVSWTDNINNLKKTIHNEIGFYNKSLENYFKKFSSIEYLNGLLNDNLGQNMYIAYNKVHTSFLGMIVAYLMKNAKLDETINYYKSVINKTNPAYNDEFELLRKYIIQNKSKV